MGICIKGYGKDLQTTVEVCLDALYQVTIALAGYLLGLSRHFGAELSV